MNAHVIWSTTRRAYVARPGSKSSFTKMLQHARVFLSREAAQRECCGDESPVAIAGIFQLEYLENVAF